MVWVYLLMHLVNEVSHSGFQMTVESNHRIALVFTLLNRFSHWLKEMVSNYYSTN